MRTSTTQAQADWKANRRFNECMPRMLLTSRAAKWKVQPGVKTRLHSKIPQTQVKETCLWLVRWRVSDMLPSPRERSFFTFALIFWIFSCFSWLPDYQRLSRFTEIWDWKGKSMSASSSHQIKLKRFTAHSTLFTTEVDQRTDTGPWATWGREGAQHRFSFDTRHQRKEERRRDTDYHIEAFTAHNQLATCSLSIACEAVVSRKTCRNSSDIWAKRIQPPDWQKL